MRKTHEVVVELFKSCGGGGLASPSETPELPEISNDTPTVFDAELGIFVIAPKRSDAPCGVFQLLFIAHRLTVARQYEWLPVRAHYVTTLEIPLG